MNNSSHCFINRYLGKRSCFAKIVKPQSRTLHTLCTVVKKNNQELNNEKALSDLQSPNVEEPIDDLGGPIFIPSIQIVKRKFHREIECQKVAYLSAQYNDNSNEILLKKIEICNLMCDFSDPESDKIAKKEKKTALQELNAFFQVKANAQKVPANIINAMFNMIENNINRPLPPVPEKYLVYDEEPLMVEVSWPHLSLVYDLLYQYQQYFPHDQHFSIDFMTKLIPIFNSCDGNERQKIVNIFTLFSATNPNFTNNLCSKYTHICREYLDGSAYPFALTPALKLFTNSFRISNNNDIEFFFSNIMNNIVPLLKTQHIATFLPLMTPIFETAITKDPKFAEFVVNFVVNHWPVAWPSKQLILIDFINGTLEKMPLKNFSSICHSVFKLYSNCLTSKSHKVAEATMKVWDNHKLITLILDNTRIIFPIVLSPLIITMKNHWNSNTKQAAASAYKQIHNIDPFVFDEISAKLVKKAKTQDTKNELVKKWAYVAKNSAKSDRDLNLAKKLSEIQMIFASNDEFDDQNTSNANAKRAH